MKFFYDTEFLEDGHIIELVSIGMVAENGAEFYAVSTEFDSRNANRWVHQHVLPQLPPPSSPLWKDRRSIRDEIYSFIRQQAGSSPVELWAWVAAYDHVALCQLWGAMPELPAKMPRFTSELKQYWIAAGKPPLPDQIEGVHHALDDARHNFRRFQIIEASIHDEKNCEANDG